VTNGSRTISTNGVDMHIAEAGEGPLVVLCHGFPELSYSWRHQLPALAAAGYHAVAPDQRGYGRTSRPEEIEAYDIMHLTDDMLGLLDVLGEEEAVFVGHDWGSIVVWNLALLAPERVRGVVGMSVPFVRRPQHPPTEILKRTFADNWFYILYFQEPGVADANLGRDPATTMRRFLCTMDGSTVSRDMSALAGARDERGMVERMPEPEGLPDWLTQAELDHFVAEFSRTGFTGGINWYRNFDRNWELTPQLAGAKVTVPALFIAGAADPVLLFTPRHAMHENVPDLRGEVLVDDAGHWVQQERPTEVNQALIEFLRSL
jgi:pimeloyl-ACP methyl ester carboxylesterase